MREILDGSNLMVSNAPKITLKWMKINQMLSNGFRSFDWILSSPT